MVKVLSVYSLVLWHVKIIKAKSHTVFSSELDTDIYSKESQWELNKTVGGPVKTAISWHLPEIFGINILFANERLPYVNALLRASKPNYLKKRKL